jgi:26S proteasome regulatory subunit T4
VLLYGPPGTGKTLLARALACNLSATFLKVVASAIVDKCVDAQGSRRGATTALPAGGAACAASVCCTLMPVLIPACHLSPSPPTLRRYIGESARVVREMFGYAKEHAPCVIFMDEIDAIGGKRMNEGSSAGERTGGRVVVVPVVVGGGLTCGVSTLVVVVLNHRSCLYGHALPHPRAPADREIQRTLMELLSQLDGFENLGQVKIVMATNRPDMLDPALLR